MSPASSPASHPPRSAGLGSRPVAVILALVVSLLAACSSASTPTSAGASGADPATATTVSAAEPYKVGVFLMVSAALLDEMIGGFEDEFLAATGLGPDEVVWDVRNAQGDASLIQSIAREFADSDMDMFAVLGTPAVLALTALEKERPIIAIAMGDPVGAGVAESLDAPGGNVTGSIDYVEPALVLDEIAKVSPPLARLGTVYDPSNQNLQVWVADLEEAVAEAGMTLETATVASSADVSAAARSLVGRVDGILIGPDGIVTGALPAVIEAASSANLPLYLTGGDVSMTGVLATLGPDYPDLGAMAAEAAAAVYEGTDPGEVPFGRPEAIEWGVNSATVEALGVTIPDDVLSAATVVGG